MDSADSTPTLQPVLTPEAILERHKQMLQHTNQQLATLTQALAQRPSTPPLHVSPVTGFRNSGARTIYLFRTGWKQSLEQSLPAMESYSGEFHKCAGFLTQITLQFRQLQKTYETDGAKIAYIVQLLQSGIELGTSHAKN